MSPSTKIAIAAMMSPSVQPAPQWLTPTATVAKSDFSGGSSRSRSRSQRWLFGRPQRR